MRGVSLLTGLVLLAALSATAQVTERATAKNRPRPVQDETKGAVSATDGPTSRTIRWREDIDYLAMMLTTKHPDFYKLIGQETFARTTAGLKRDVPQVPDSEIIFRLSRLLASLGVAHTNLGARTGIGRMAIHEYPLEMRWFSDDLAVVAAAPEYREALGCRVVRIGSLPPMRLEEVVAPYISYENQAHLRHRSPGYMMMVELMEREKIADADGHLKVTCAKADGKEFTLDLPPRRQGSRNRDMVSVSDVYHGATTIRQTNMDALYTYEYLQDARTLLIQMHHCREEKKNPAGLFLSQLFGFADSHPVRRVVIDMRFEGGGIQDFMGPLLQGLKTRPNLSVKGHLYVLTNNITYSAGQNAAVEFWRDLHAIVVGEPGGTKPNHYGQAPAFNLPNSKMSVQCATKRIHTIRGADPKSLEPDIRVPQTLGDFLAGRDRVLETVLAQPLPQR